MKILLTIIAIFIIQNIVAQEVLNLPSISTTTKQIAEKDAKKIIDYVGKNKKILVLPFYSNDDKITAVSISISKELTSALQTKVQKKGKNITFFYPDEYNKDGNKVLQETHQSQTENVGEYWKSIIDKFNPDYYVEGYYFIEQDSYGKYKLTIKNVFVKTNYLNTNSGLTKIALSNATAYVTDNNFINSLNAKPTIFIESEEDLFGQSSRTIKNKLRTNLQKQGYTVERKDENTEYQIFIEATTREYNNSKGIYFSYADVYLELSQNGKAILQKDYTEKGGSALSYKDAGQKAFNSISEKISTEVINSIK